MKRIVVGSIEKLKRRGLVDWLDLDVIVKRQLSRARNHGDTLIVLASLELVLQARG